MKFAAFLSSSPLQFGFKAGSSTTLCTGMVKNVVSRYINNRSCVLGCFLDAFDLVNHDILFHKLSVRGLPLPVIRFLSSWYCSQQMKARWDHSLSESFTSLMVLGKVVCSLLCYLLFIWMVYLRNWLIVVVVVIGVTCLLERFAMQMILFCWHHVHLLSE